MASAMLKPVALAALMGGLTILAADQAGAQVQRPPPDSVIAWSPKPIKATPWTAPNKAHWKLADVLAKHRGRNSWREAIVRDRDFEATYVQMAPGEKTKTQFWPDNRVFWIVQDGEMRVTIEGQEPFVASKGFLVQVPYRVPYSIETVGDKPSLRFEVTQAGAAPLYPATETPTPVPGKTYVKVAFNGKGAYDEANKPFLDFNKDIVQGGARGGAFVRDDHTFANVIRGRGQPVPPATNLGHFHNDYGEFWLVMEGQIDYLIEGVPFFSAQAGDVVYAPVGRWHRASFGGTGPATRLAINPRPAGLHNYEAPH